MNKNELLIYSMILGDGWLCKKDLRIQHSEKQLNYLKWKKRILEKNGIECSTIKCRTNPNGFGIQKNYFAYYFYTKSYSFIKEFKEFYYNPDKTACILNNLDNLTPLSLAIWYMDDGGLSQQKDKNGNIKANDLMLNTGLQKEGNQIIIDYFKRVWNISFTQAKNKSVYRLRCGTTEARKFADIIKPYLIQNPELLYKIQIKNYII